MKFLIFCLVSECIIDVTLFNDSDFMYIMKISVLFFPVRICIVMFSSLS